MPSLTAQCQDIASSAKWDDYSLLYTSPWEGIKPELDTYIVCTDTVRFEEHYTEGGLPHRIH